MRQKSPRLPVVSNIIWICWFVACLTRSNEVVLTVCLVGAMWNVLLLLNERRKGKKNDLQFIICGAFFLIVAMGNLWYIVFIR